MRICVRFSDLTCVYRCLAVRSQLSIIASVLWDRKELTVRREEARWALGGSVVDTKGLASEHLFTRLFLSRSMPSWCPLRPPPPTSSYLLLEIYVVELLSLLSRPPLCILPARNFAHQGSISMLRATVITGLIASTIMPKRRDEGSRVRDGRQGALT